VPDNAPASAALKGQSRREVLVKAYQVQRNSFLIRIWREQDQTAWRGWVQHIRTGEATPIRDLEELKEFFERYSGQLSKPPPGGLK
jgi:hypothetical protein